VVKNLDTLAGSQLVPTSYDGASGYGLFSYTDSVATASFASISNFGANDSIAITGGGNNHLVVANSGADVVLTVNANGVVSQITVLGVTTSSATIGSIEAFNALSVGNVSYDGPVAQSLDVLGGTQQTPVSFDAASGLGLFSFTDSVATADFVSITNFSADDSISFTGGGSNHLVVANSGADVVLTVNASGTVSQITLVGVTTAATLIGSIVAFNALSVGDVSFG